jgi:molybdate transport system substrate-binding protein
MKLFTALVLCTVWGTAMAVDIKVLSAGAVEPGLVKVAEQFRKDTGHRARITFNTAPQIEKRLGGGEVADVVIAPPGVMDNQMRRNKIEPDSHVVVGRVGVGVVVRADANEPDIATLERFKQSLQSADSLVYNQASTGLYLERMFDLLGIADALKAKTTRYANGAQVMEHVIAGKGNEVGFGAITEIRLMEPKGLKYVGPLPAQVQNYTSYAAGVMTEAPAPELARDFVKYLASPASKAMFFAAGIE